MGHLQKGLLVADPLLHRGVHLHPRVGNHESLESVQVLPCQIEAPLHDLPYQIVVHHPDLLAPGENAHHLVGQTCYHGEGDQQCLEESCLEARDPQILQVMGLKILVCDLFDPDLLSVC